MSQATASVVIVGAGVMGASIACHLAARGCADVLILEKEQTEISGTTARSVAGVHRQFSSEVNIRLSLYSIERIALSRPGTSARAERHMIVKRKRNT